MVSNQAGIALKADPKKPAAQKNKLATFKTKASAVFSQLDLPISLYAATEKDIFRKPRTGMWKELIEDYDLDESGETVDLENSFFVGDAAGRVAGSGMSKDFSCSDRYIIFTVRRIATSTDMEKELCRQCGNQVSHSRGILSEIETQNF